MDYAALKAADAALPGAPLSLAAAATALNAQTVVATARDVAWSSIRDVLMNNFDWGTLVGCTVPVGATLPGGAVQTLPVLSAAVAIHECCIYGGTFNAANQTVWNRLTTAAGLLTPASVGGISSASATAVTALRTPTVPTWGAVNAGDVQTARAQL